MPPKAKFTRIEIIQAALSMVKEDGLDSLTARSLGKRLGSSSRPIFTLFQNMEEVLKEVKQAANEIYNGYMKEALQEEMAFKAVGKAYIRFAKEDPHLFQLLYMSEREPSSKAFNIMLQDDNHEEIAKSIQDMYGVEQVDAWKIYQHLWIYTHGIASLCAMQVCSFDNQEIDALITDVFTGLLIQVKRRS